MLLIGALPYQTLNKQQHFFMSHSIPLYSSLIDFLLLGPGDNIMLILPGTCERFRLTDWNNLTGPV